MTNFSIETRNLSRTFKLDRAARKEAGRTLTALDNLNLQVRPGELFGLLGPNGAGKTTSIRILCTLLLPTVGEAFIEGLDVVRDVWKVRRIINMVSGGETCGYGILNARENLRLFTELYGIPWRIAKPRIEQLLKVVGLDKLSGMKINKLSTGLRQRLNFARGFTTDPKVLFLDEPTVGLDPLPDSLEELPGVQSLTTSREVDRQVTLVHALLTDPEAGGELIGVMTGNGWRLMGLKTTQPTLEDVFVKLTGRSQAIKLSGKI